MSAENQRRESLAARRALSTNYRATASDAICRQLVRSRRFANSTTIAVYLAQRDEVSLDDFISVAWKCGKRVCVPVVAQKFAMHFALLTPESSIVRNRYGIWEAKSDAYVLARDIDWVIVPTVAFDAAMHRIGMGSGYYDRAFAFRKHTHRSLPPVLSGAAFACQEVPAIAPNPWDIGLSRIFTEQSVQALRISDCSTYKAST